MKAVVQVFLLTSALLLADIARAQDIELEPDRVWRVPASVEALREGMNEDMAWSRVQIAASEAYLGARAAGAADPAKAWTEVIRRSREFEDWEAEIAIEAGIGEAPCPFSAGGRCLLSSGEYYPATPASPTLREAVFNGPSCSEHQPLELEFAWRRVEDVPDAEPRLLELFDLARSGRAVDCDEDGDCVTVHPVSIPEGAPDVRAELAACRTVRVGDTLGAPSDCVAILLRADEDRYLSMISGTTSMACYAIASTEFMVIGSGDYPVRLGDRLVAGFEGDPLNYGVTRNADRIRAVSRYKVSPFLRPYREIATVEVFTSSRPLEGGHSATAVFVETSVLVNRQNTRRPQDWRMPDDQQSDAYRRGVADLVRRHLASACGRALRRVGPYFECSPDGEIPAGAERAFQEIMFRHAYR